MLSIDDIYKAQDDIEELKKNISDIGLSNFEDLLTSEWGELGSSAKIHEVSFLKGTKEQIDSYIGAPGQVIVDTENNDLYLMYGNGIAGGKKLGAQEGNGQTCQTLSVQITSDSWSADGNYFSCMVSHNFSSLTENIDIKFFKATANVLLNYEIVDQNSIKVYSDEEATLTCIVKCFSASQSDVSYFEITPESWTGENIFYHNLAHLKDISLENIDVKFYKENKYVLLSYEVIDNNNIKIYSDEKTSVKVVIRKV